jgi:large subunit ribosomal protein L4
VKGGNNIMANFDVLKVDGSKSGSIELNDSVFGIEPNQHVLFEAVNLQRASLRQGTHAVKNRSAVRGGGRKPWKQKGTGRARQGTIRAPQWRGGGIVFGPTPRSYSYKMPKKMRRLALRSALSAKANDNELAVLEAFNFDAPKTKELKNVMSNLELSKKVLFIVDALDNNVELSARNIPSVKVIDAQSLNVLDILDANKVVITKAAVDKVEEVLG